MLHSLSESGISVDSAPAMQALWSKGIELGSHPQYFVCHYQCYDEFKAIGPLLLICVETNWAGSWFAMAVLGCRSLVLVK